MKRIIVFLLIVCISQPLSGCFAQIQTNSLSEAVTKNSIWKITVNEEPLIFKEDIQVHQNAVELPFTKVLAAINAQIEVLSKNQLRVQYNNTEYVLDIYGCSLTEKGQDINLISPPLGATRYYHSKESELYLDSITMSGAFQLIGLNMITQIDRENRIIDIRIR